jgi:hypothetical protein
MLIWLENHLVILGLLAVIGGLGLGAMLTLGTSVTAAGGDLQRNAGSAIDWRRRSPASSGASGSVTTGAESMKPR